MLSSQHKSYAVLLPPPPECEVSVEFFFETWFLNMEFTESRNSSKINTIAVLTLLPRVSAEMFSKYFHYTLKRMLPDIHNYLEL